MSCESTQGNVFGRVGSGYAMSGHPWKRVQEGQVGLCCVRVHKKMHSDRSGLFGSCRVRVRREMCSGRSGRVRLGRVGSCEGT